MPQWMQDLIAGWPMISANIPTFLVIIVLIIGAVWAAMAWAYGRIISHQSAEINLLERQKAEASAVPARDGLKERAELRLHVYGDNRLPERLSANNIWRWYYMHEVLVMLNQDGSKRSEILTSKLFICFDQPVSVGTLSIKSDRPLARYEVKEFNNRFAIIHFGEAPIESNIEIDVRP
jgi:hypothetical protein